jgi:hypothetical protein
MTNVSPHLYARGFIITPNGMKGGMAHWQAIDFGPWRLSHDLRTPAFESSDGEKVVILLGTTPESQQLAADRILAAQGMDAQKEIDSLTGRYLVIRYSPTHGLRIQQDAAGMRAAYYTDPQYPMVIGSHVSLVANTVGAQPGYFGYSDFIKGNNLRTYPGRATGRLGIQRLTPNTELHAGTRKVTRFYPSQQIVRRSVADVAELIIGRAREQIEDLEASGRPVMSSLTAGLDSRVTLALMRHCKDALYFTYDIQYKAKNRASEHDLGTALEIASKFGLRHQVVAVQERDVPEETRSAMARNTPLNHARALAYAYMEQLPAGSLHVRSNVYEIGRSYYRGAGYTTSDLTAKEMLYIASSKKSRDRSSVDAFQEFKNSTEFDSAAQFGYDPLDLFYWEHRMGAWMATILHESDIAHETHILINSREILDATLGLTLEERLSGAVFFEVIKQAWPELLEFPINGKLTEVSNISP